MTKNDAEEYIQKYLNDQNMDNKVDDCREQFIFTFTERDDMEKFLRETRDKQKMLVHTTLGGNPISPIHLQTVKKSIIIELKSVAIQ